MRLFGDVSLIGVVGARFSGIENMNFFGFGNETADIEDKALYKTETNECTIFPPLRFQPGTRFELHVGPQAGVVQTKGGDSLVEQEQPYGVGEFGQVAFRAGLAFDSRGRARGMTEARGMAAPDATAATAAPPASGARIRAESLYVPKAWDATEDFGGLDGSVAGYLGNQTLVLATQVGGRVLWGPYPWFESASILRGRRRHRGRRQGARPLRRSLPGRLFAVRQRGAALVARLPQEGVLPLRWGLTTFVESGRVWYEGEDSKKWRTGGGVGLLVQLTGTPMAFGGSIATGTEGVKFYFSGGYAF